MISLQYAIVRSRIGRYAKPHTGFTARRSSRDASRPAPSGRCCLKIERYLLPIVLHRCALCAGFPAVISRVAGV